ncbi:zinc-dependent alcohol dehydrogenase [Sediminispirochaeta smaragdinae]|jgi:threonine 3-dehydrogenase|uniref:Alcohol dehydrogenase GroES domain protein n=1 Tax=Sediminispirochaeta smaragdinae (strain DSM 11293 / JCM 15392 / SEBR 4228) TaxID=573413 RepID=E1R2I4_SEDSS|nr:alcohol dehydrogenase catalytic domain-containing protein [Sediminispirochaeta smaragdinae]ADK82544.1 Alcohol dehydrogenase GroES domain protein [Sediminispirochaeta smaragdinae DSM 11293]
MKAAVFEGNGKLTIKDVSEPKLTKATDALIRVKGVGICGTDLHILQVPPAHPAKLNNILGHEFTGEIVELGSEVQGFSVGERVLIDPHPGCGVCDECRRGYPDNCIPLYEECEEPGHPNTIGIFSPGAYTKYVIVPRQSLYKIDPKVPVKIAALAEPLSCVVNATEKLKVTPGQYVVILGAGPIGLLFTMLMKANGASKIIVSEPAKFRREAAIGCGADIVVDPKQEDISEVVAREMGKGADVCIEAVGPLLPLAIMLVRAGGKVLQFGHDETVKPAIPVGVMLKKEVEIYGAFIGKQSFEKTVRIMESGKLPLEKVVSHTLPLSRIHEGIDKLRKGEGLKIIIMPEDA